MNKAMSARQEGTKTRGFAGFVGRVYGHRRRFATVAATALTVGMGYHVIFGQNGLTAYEQKRENVHALEQQLRSLKDENDQLTGHVERLENDPGAIEHQAREELHYTRPGEVIVTLPPETPAKQ
jgi:cell division protein FtsB